LSILILLSYKKLTVCFGLKTTLTEKQGEMKSGEILHLFNHFETKAFEVYQFQIE